MASDATGDKPEMSVDEQVRSVLERAYARALEIEQSDDRSIETAAAGEELADAARALGSIQHAARGAALTLCAYKAVVPAQDVTAHMVEFPGGFAARPVDAEVTVPFLQEHSLPKSSESHWLTRRIVEQPLHPQLVPKTTPKRPARYWSEWSTL